ncbi:hypothetical protein J3458_014530 [Metarhizium acridum]|uniref:uncharacterized protein n=1 Tax=Metarhizium acridum TaxID=92637 RepID=UPI001C6B6695|nr:hypothetical protein J3458_014530 [Metarhizium acridum]
MNPLTCLVSAEKHGATTSSKSALSRQLIQTLSKCTKDALDTSIEYNKQLASGSRLDAVLPPEVPRTWAPCRGLLARTHVSVFVATDIDFNQDTWPSPSRRQHAASMLVQISALDVPVPLNPTPRPSTVTECPRQRLGGTKPYELSIIQL